MRRMLTPRAAAVLALGGSLVARVRFRNSRSTPTPISSGPPRHPRRRGRGVCANSKGQSLSTRGPAIRTQRSATTAPFTAAARGCASSLRTASSCASLARTCKASTPRTAAHDPQDNVWTSISREPGREVRPDGRIALVLGRKPETINVRPRVAGPVGPWVLAVCGPPRRQARATGRWRSRCTRGTRWTTTRSRGAAGGRGGAPDGPAARAGRRRRRGGQQAAPGSGTPAPASIGPRRRLGQGRQHLHADASATQPHREVRQGRPLHQALGLDRQRSGTVSGIEHWSSTRRTTSTSPTLAQADRVFDSEGNFNRRSATSALPRDVHHSRATQYLYVSHVAIPSWKTGDYSRARRQGGRQVRKAGKMPKELRR